MLIKVVASLLPAMEAYLKEHRKQKIKLSRLKRRIAKEAAKYSFLHWMLDDKGKGHELVPHVLAFFKYVGYRKVEEMDFKRVASKKNLSEDIGIFYKNNLIVCEITSRKDNSNPPDEKGIKVASYMAKAKTTFPDKTIYGILVINSWWEETDLTKRDRMPYSISQIETAESMGYGLTTTKQLVNGFIQLKRKEITFEEFHKKLTTIGLIKFSK